MDFDPTDVGGGEEDAIAVPLRCSELSSQLGTMTDRPTESEPSKSFSEIGSQHEEANTGMFYFEISVFARWYFAKGYLFY